MTIWVLSSYRFSAHHKQKNSLSTFAKGAYLKPNKNPVFPG